MNTEEMKQKYIEVNRRNAFIRHNGIEVQEVGPDRAVLYLTIRDESRNLHGLVHGGAIYAMADNAAGCAASTDGRSYVTQSSNMHFLRNQAEGVVRAEAQVRHRGKSTVLVAVDIRGEDGRLMATGEFCFFCLDRARMEQKAKGAQT